MSIKGPVLLYGAGREARSTRQFLREIAPDLRVDICVDKGPSDIAETKQVPVSTLDDAFKNGQYATLVRSPGVSIYKPEIIAAKNAGVHITTNVNLWAEYKRGNTKILALTGTKGKSTTAKLLYTILQVAGFDVGLAGNIGIPVLELEHHDYVILELSSFQCADMQFDPDFIGITSLFPEHLDWHGDEARYFADKLNILRRNKPYKCALSTQIARHKSLPQPPPGLVNKLPAPSPRFCDILLKAITASRLKGDHNLQNAILAARLALGAGANEQAILEGIAAFEPLPHRLEELHLAGKIFVNDSIATNPEATKAAVLTYANQNVALIIGGFDRGQDYDNLVGFLLDAPVSSIWMLPDTGTRIAGMLESKAPPFPVHKIKSLEEIFSQLKSAPDQFDVLLLSPGAPSFNQFDNFEHRGETFRDLARKSFTDTK